MDHNSKIMKEMNLMKKAADMAEDKRLSQLLWIIPMLSAWLTREISSMISLKTKTKDPIKADRNTMNRNYLELVKILLTKISNTKNSYAKLQLNDRLVI
jgi:hypothetical protein